MFKQYNRTEKAELRLVSNEEIENGVRFVESLGISISKEDRITGSPTNGDMVARNPKNHKDQWLVAAEYFRDNFEEV